MNTTLQHALDLLSSPWAVMILGGIVDLVMRFVKTKEPRSLLILIGAAFNLIGSIFLKLSQMLDGVLQRTKDPIDGIVVKTEDTK